MQEQINGFKQILSLSLVCDDLCRCRQEYRPRLTTFDLFYTTILKITKEIFVKICGQFHRLRLETVRAALCKWATCTRQLSFQNFCKLPQHAEAIRKHCLGKEKWRVPIVDKSTYRPQNHILIKNGKNVKENVFFLQSASSKRHCVTHWCEQRGMNSYQQWQIVVKL